MEDAARFNPVAVGFKLDGKVHVLKKFSLERQLQLSMRFSENKGIENGIKNFAEILSHPENIQKYFDTVTEVVYSLFKDESKKDYVTLCSFRESMGAEAEDTNEADIISRTRAITEALNAAIENSQPVIDAARIQVDNENLKKKLILEQQKVEKLQGILGLKRSLNSQGSVSSRQ